MSALPRAADLRPAFAAVFLWLLFAASDLGRSFIGGLAFRCYAAFHPPFHLGDRVTLSGTAGMSCMIVMQTV